MSDSNTDSIAPQSERTDDLSCTAKDERRAISRWPVELHGVFYSNNSNLKCMVTDLSTKGARLISAERLPVGSTLTLAVTVGRQDSVPIIVECCVRNVCGGCIGVEFLNIKPADRIRIVQYGKRAVCCQGTNS